MFLLSWAPALMHSARPTMRFPSVLCRESRGPSHANGSREPFQIWNARKTPDASYHYRVPRVASYRDDSLTWAGDAAANTRSSASRSDGAAGAWGTTADSTTSAAP